MKILHAAVVAVLSFGLTGCVVSEQKFVQSRTIIKSRPDIRAKLINECVRDANALSKDKRELYAELVDLTPATFSQGYCRRVMRSYLSGRITYQDYKDMAHGKPTLRILRMLKGK